MKTETIKTHAKIVAMLIPVTLLAWLAVYTIGILTGQQPFLAY